MKQFLLLASLFASASMFASGVQPERVASAPAKINAVSEEIITTPGEGKLTSPVYGSSSRTWLIYNNAPASMVQNDGYAVKTVQGVEMYIYNFISEFPTDSWIKGSMISDGTVVFDLPQKVYHKDAEGGMPAQDYYLAVLTPSKDAQGNIVLTADPENSQLKFTSNGTRLSQVVEQISDPELSRYAGMVGLVNADGGFIGYAEQGVRYNIDTFVTAEAPAASLGEPKSYIVNYTDQNKEEKHLNVEILVAGNDAWIKGLNAWLPEVWIKGTNDNGTLTFDCQYAGETHNYLTFIGGFNPISSSNPITSFNLEPVGETYKASRAIFINLGNYKPNPSIEMNDAVFSPYSVADAVPADPADFEPEQYTESEGVGLLYFTLPATDTAGNKLDTGKLFYNVYIDGKLFTLEKPEYTVAEPLTDIPYAFESDEVLPTGDGGIIFCFFREIDSIGIQSLYKGDSTNYSNLVTHFFKQGGVDSAIGDDVVAVEYLDLQGRRVATPEAGLCIRLTRKADGSVKADKVFVIR